jgi:curved DNA-binding protein CbpA
MTDDTNEEVTLNDDGTPVLNPRIREQLRNQEKQLAEANKRLRDSELRAIFAEVGIGTTGAAKLFRDTYSGEATPEAVRNSAAEYDVLPTNSSVDPGRQSELDALRRINGATDPAASSDATDVLNDTLAKLRKAKTVEEFDEIMGSPEVQALRHQPIAFM